MMGWPAFGDCDAANSCSEQVLRAAGSPCSTAWCQAHMYVSVSRPRLSVICGGLVLPYCLVCTIPPGPVEMYSTGSTSVLMAESTLNVATWIPSTWITKLEAVITVGLPLATAGMGSSPFGIRILLSDSGGAVQAASSVAEDDRVAGDDHVLGHHAFAGPGRGDVDPCAPGVLQGHRGHRRGVGDVGQPAAEHLQRHVGAGRGHAAQRHLVPVPEREVRVQAAFERDARRLGDPELLGVVHRAARVHRDVLLDADLAVDPPELLEREVAHAQAGREAGPADLQVRCRHHEDRGAGHRGEGEA